MKKLFIVLMALCSPIANAQQDYSGRVAGYQWAAKYRLTSTYQCAGNSRSFIEGCLEYVMAATYSSNSGRTNIDNFLANAGIGADFNAERRVDSNELINSIIRMQELQLRQQELQQKYYQKNR